MMTSKEAKAKVRDMDNRIQLLTRDGYGHLCVDFQRQREEALAVLAPKPKQPKGPRVKLDNYLSDGCIGEIGQAKITEVGEWLHITRIETVSGTGASMRWTNYYGAGRIVSAERAAKINAEYATAQRIADIKRTLGNSISMEMHTDASVAALRAELAQLEAAQ